MADAELGLQAHRGRNLLVLPQGVNESMINQFLQDHGLPVGYFPSSDMGQIPGSHSWAQRGRAELGGAIHKYQHINTTIKDLSLGLTKAVAQYNQPAFSTLTFVGQLRPPSAAGTKLSMMHFCGWSAVRGTPFLPPWHGSSRTPGLPIEARQLSLVTQAAQYRCAIQSAAFARAER